MTFEQAIELILSPQIEGGYVFDKYDPGGETNMGISKRSYPHLDIKNLTRKQAIEIYRKDFWEPLRPMLLPARLRLCLFDCAINQGKPRAIRILQGSVGAQQDGIMGVQTIEAASMCVELEVLEHMFVLRINHYQKLPTWQRYGAGWMKRLVHIAIETMK